MSALGKAILLLRLVAESNGALGIKDLSESSGLPPSTVHRILRDWAGQGFVEQVARRRYRVGLAMVRLSGLVLHRNPLADVADPVLASLTAETGETSVLSAYIREERCLMFTAKRDSVQPLRYRVRLYERQTLFWGATGRVILAHLPQEELCTLLLHPDPSPRTGGLPDIAELERELSTIRERGFALSRAQRYPGAVATAVPVFLGGRLAGCLSLTIPEHRFHEDRSTELVATLRRHAEQLTAVWTERDQARR